MIQTRKIWKKSRIPLAVRVVVRWLSALRWLLRGAGGGRIMSREERELETVQWTLLMGIHTHLHDLNFITRMGFVRAINKISFIYPSEPKNSFFFFMFLSFCSFLFHVERIFLVSVSSNSAWVSVSVYLFHTHRRCRRELTFSLFFSPRCVFLFSPWRELELWLTPAKLLSLSHPEKSSN